MADKKGEERSRLAGYEVGFSGSRPDGLSLICAEGTYVEGQRQGYADYLKNKDLAERIAAGAKASVVKTEERSSTAGVTERVVEVESSREREENEERRHRELLDAVEDHDDGEDYEEEDEEEDRPPVEPLIYSEKTRRVSGMAELKKIIAKTESVNLLWQTYVNFDHDSSSGFDGITPDGRSRIRICLTYLVPEYLKLPVFLVKILELEDFNVISAYYPLSGEEKNLANQLARGINMLIKVENLHQLYSKGMDCYNNAMSYFNKGDKSTAETIFRYQARASFDRVCRDADTLIAGLSGMPDDLITVASDTRNAAYYALLATDNMFINWESNYFDYVNYCSELSHCYSILADDFLHPTS